MRRTKFPGAHGVILARREEMVPWLCPRSASYQVYVFYIFFFLQNHVIKTSYYVYTEESK